MHKEILEDIGEKELINRLGKFMPKDQISDDCALIKTKNENYGLKTLDDFPKEAIEFISKIEEVCGVSVDIISTGPERESTIFKNDII